MLRRGICKFAQRFNTPRQIVDFALKLNTLCFQLPIDFFHVLGNARFLHQPLDSNGRFSVCALEGVNRFKPLGFESFNLLCHLFSI